MTKLEKLYSIIENSCEVGVELSQDVLQQVEDLEEKIIKEDILPTLSANLEPLMQPIRRDLVLVVEYHPGQPISVALSRKVKVAESLGAKSLNFVSAGAPISMRTSLRVTLPDGSIIQEQESWMTFVEAIKVAGVERVRELGLILDTVPVVSDKLCDDPVYRKAQKQIENGLYIMTHGNNSQKIRRLKEISKAFNLNWKIDVAAQSRRSRLHKSQSGQC